MGERTALIGHTGFVGSNLLRQREFDDCFNSTSIGEIAGREYDLIVCAGVTAVKWLANKEPDADRAGIVRLTDALETVRAREFVLISTVDVYPDPSAPVDEAHTIDPSANHAYGAHRYRLERWIADRFENARIVRLPALFGPGLRKNAIYDLLNDNAIENIDPGGVFQWYPVARLADDIDRIRDEDLSLVNLVGDGIAMDLIIRAFFPGVHVGEPSTTPPRYDLRTRHAAAFGGTDGRIIGEAAILGELARYVAAERLAH